MEQKIKLRTIDTLFDFQILDIHLDGNAKIGMLKNLMIPEINRKKGILINGRSPIWLFIFLYKNLLKMNLPFIASYDPKIGGVILESKDKSRIFGKINNSILGRYIKQDSINTKVIAFFGPPHSGKTVFMFNLYKTLLKSDYKFFNENAIILKGAPDGEGIWSSEINQKLVKLVRYKNKYDAAFIRDVIRNIENAKIVKPIIFVNCGGKVDKTKELIASKCTHSILVSNDTKKYKDWRNISKGLSIIAEVESTLDKRRKNKADLSKKPLKILMNDLDRANKNVKIPEDFMAYIIKYLKE